MRAAPRFQTNNVSLTAALGVLGFGWVDPDRPCTNYYGKNDPIPRDNQNRPIYPGTVTFFTKRTSDEFQQADLEKLLDEWKGGSADKDLDELIKPAAGDSKDVARLKASINRILPCALFAYQKATLAGRKTVANAFRDVVPKRAWVNDDGSAIMLDADSEECKREVGA